MSQHYIIYGGELSYFTRKLEAAMIFYGADFEMRTKTPDMAQEIQLRSGTHQVPVLQTPENWTRERVTVRRRHPIDRLFLPPI